MSRSDIWFYLCPEHQIPFQSHSLTIVLVNLTNHLMAEHGMTLEEATKEAKIRLKVTEDE